MTVEGRADGAGRQTQLRADPVLAASGGRRSSFTADSTAAVVRRGQRWGREERSINPAGSCFWKRRTLRYAHWCETPSSAAT